MKRDSCLKKQRLREVWFVNGELDYQREEICFVVGLFIGEKSNKLQKYSRT